MKDKKQRIIEYKGYHIVQEVEWKDNPVDGAGYEGKTTITEIPRYSLFFQLVWLNKEHQKKKMNDGIDSAKYIIDCALKEKEPTIFDELGFKNI